MSPAMRAHLLLPFVLAGCTSDEKYIVVTIESRPAVRDVAKLRVTLSNAGSMRTEDLPLGNASFPATFSISPEDRTGELGIAVEAFDGDDGLVGRGVSQSTIETPTASVLLEPTDFVVNTEYANDQQLSNYFGASGFQLAAHPDGTWTTVYNASCSTPCNVFGRRFDTTARPVVSAIAAGTPAFPLSTKLTTFFSVPAVAANATTTLAVWNARDSAAATYSIECRALDTSGNAAASQKLISSDEFPDVVSATALPNGNFVVAWDGRQGGIDLVRAAVVLPDCTPMGAISAVTPSVAGARPGRSHAAANATTILYAWTLANSVRVRAANLGNVFTGPDTELLAKTATEHIEFVRVAPLGAGFAVIARWAQITGATGPGRLELYRVSNAGAVMGPPVLISERSGSDFASSESFGVAPGRDGSLLVVWHACLEKGDGSGCGVFGRLMGPSGAPLGPELVIPTTTADDQHRPSAVALPDGAFAVAWTDRSTAAPDSSGTAVRARIIYPAADGAAGLQP
jgi:hypothetical protein